MRKLKNWLKDAGLVDKVSKLLSLVDTGISNVIVHESADADEIKFPENFPEELKQLYREDRKYKPVFIHATDTGSSEIFEEKEESHGTRKLFNLAPLLFETLSKGGVFIMDELDNNMHPFMAELIIKLFNDS